MPGNDILFRYQPSGASTRTSAQSEQLKKKKIVGVKASHTFAEEDLERLRQYALMFVALGKKYDVPPALLAAIASRESRAGAQLSNGWGDHHNGYGLMQVDKRAHTLKGGPYSLEHLNQATGILQDSIRAVTKQHPDWAAEQQLRGGVAAYNFGSSNVRSIAGMDSGTTGDDYSNDVWARAQFLAPYIGGGTGSAATTAPPPAPKSSAAAAPREVVRDLQLWLVRHHYMTEAEMQTGPGLPGPKTHEAVARFLAGHDEASQGTSTARPSSPLKAVPSPAPKSAPGALAAPSAPVASGGTVTATYQTARKVTVPFYSQFEGGHGYTPSGVACFKACCAMAKAAGVRIVDLAHRIQVGVSENHKGHLKVNAKKVAEGRHYIDSQLDAGKPVVVGVSHEDGAPSLNEGLTDHFVIITSRGTDTAGRLYYAFHDPATRHPTKGSDTNVHNRFHVDAATENLHKSGTDATGYVVDRHFEVAMVGRNA